MRSIIKKLPKSQVELEIELSAEEFNGFIDRAILNLAKNLEIKGFRKGKAPKPIVEKEIGEEKILAEAGDLAVKENYKKAIIENEIKPISQFQIEIKKIARGNPFVFLAKTAVLPKIKLGDYKKIASKVERKKTRVEEKEIDDALKWLQKSRAKFTLKNGPAEKGDFVEIEYWSSQLGNSIDPKGQKDSFILGEGQFISGFEERLIGMKVDEEKEVPLTLPKNENTEAKPLQIKVKINSVQNVEFSKIDDQFAQSLGSFENLAGLKENVKKGLNLEKERAESQRIRKEILEKISQTTDCEVPEILVEREQNQMMENLKKNVSEKLNPHTKRGQGAEGAKIDEVSPHSGVGVKISFQDYLNKIGKTEEEILNSFLPEAQNRIKNFFILREIAKKEEIESSKEEIKKEIDKLLKHYPDVKTTKEKFDPVKSRESGPSPSQKGWVFNGVDLEDLEEYTKEAIKNEKVFQLLEQFIDDH